MVAVWMLYHLPESVKESRWLTDMPVKQPESCIPGSEKKKILPQTCDRKIMLFLWLCPLCLLFFNFVSFIGPCAGIGR